MKRTKAAVLEATGGSLQLAELDIEEPSANEVAIRVVACGLCHSDHPASTASCGRRPVVLGHEGGDSSRRWAPECTHLKAGDQSRRAERPRWHEERERGQ